MKQTCGHCRAGQSRHVAGEGLVQAMRSVPLEFFAEDFSLQRCVPHSIIAPVERGAIPTCSAGDGCCTLYACSAGEGEAPQLRMDVCRAHVWPRIHQLPCSCA